MKAWQRLIRVLGHELNNSLAPIKSIAGSLGGRIAQLPIGEQDRIFKRDWKSSKRGLGP